MTLGTKIRDRWKGNQISKSRSMRSMATQALHRDVFVSRIDDLLPHGVARMLRPVMAGFAEFYSGSLLQKKAIIRRMGKMAAFAISFLYWIMRQCSLNHSPLSGSIFLLLFFGELFLHRHGVNMTLSTQGLHIPHQKLFLRRTMRFMAVQTAHFINQGPVDSVLIKGVIHHAVVASPAQLKPRLFRLQRVGRSGCLMTLRARLVGNRCMHIIE